MELHLFFCFSFSEGVTKNNSKINIQKKRREKKEGQTNALNNGQSPPQEPQEGPHIKPFLLVIITNPAYGRH